MSKIKILENLIKRIVMEEKKKLKESGDKYDRLASKLKLGKSVSYKAGTGHREGQEVLSGPKSLIGLLTGSALKSIQEMEKSGVVFDKAYVQFRNIDKSYTGSGSGKTWTYSLFGKDSSGNDIIYDKYEGNTAGGGQSWVFVNNKKNKASDYVSGIQLRPIQDALESAGFKPNDTKEWFNSGKIDIWFKDYETQESATKVFNKVKAALPKIKPVLNQYPGDYYLIIYAPIYNGKVLHYRVVLDELGNIRDKDQIINSVKI